MTRKILILVAALIVPGGLIALACASLLKLLQQSPRGRKFMDLARSRAPSWTPFGGVAERQAAA